MTERIKRNCSWDRIGYEHEWREDVVSESGHVCIYCGMPMPEDWPDDDDEGVAEERGEGTWLGLTNIEAAWRRGDFGYFPRAEK